ncbi:hypothetical protein EVAR_4783_1 [Eumeta japonica]|uniref:Uncharacterized protein n=1 Tax=Eumeta variegata TaxID=151549 RepID=A0A4C1SYS7_EUMVA|nr:hypothetical protein EVAR_4783_1 [Eumeta japonica]
MKDCNRSVGEFLQLCQVNWMCRVLSLRPGLAPLDRPGVIWRKKNRYIFSGRTPGRDSNRVFRKRPNKVLIGVHMKDLRRLGHLKAFLKRNKPAADYNPVSVIGIYVVLGVKGIRNELEILQRSRTGTGEGEASSANRRGAGAAPACGRTVTKIIGFRNDLTELEGLGCHYEFKGSPEAFNKVRDRPPPPMAPPTSRLYGPGRTTRTAVARAHRLRSAARIGFGPKSRETKLFRVSDPDLRNLDVLPLSRGRIVFSGRPFHGIRSTAGARTPPGGPGRTRVLAGKLTFFT